LQSFAVLAEIEAFIPYLHFDTVEVKSRNFR